MSKTSSFSSRAFFHPLGALAMPLLAAFLLCCAISNAATVPSDTVNIKSDLTEADVANLRGVLEQLGEAFVAHDAAKVDALLVGGSEQKRIMENVKREFNEARYLDFHVLEITPDLKVGPRRHSVDVRVQFQLIYSIEERPADARHIIQTDMQFNFVVVRNNKGEFRIYSSDLFNNLGRHSGGLPTLLANGMIVLVSVMALFLFWIWMASFALWLRPRNRFWRAFVLWTPPIGAVIFFFTYCLPRWMRGEKITGR